MAFVLIIFIAASVMLFNAVQPPGAIDQANVDTIKELVKTKESLIAFATNYPELIPDSFDSNQNDGPGRLPCPAYGDIVPYSTGCNWEYALRLPEYASTGSGINFEFSDAYAGLDLQFWYSVSSDYRWYRGGMGGLPKLNSSVAGELTLDGDPVVAVIIAPGPALSGQDRSAPEDSNNTYGAEEYLEDVNAGWSTGVFVSGDASDPANFNDLVVGISRSDIMTPVTARVVKEIKTNLDSYHPGNSDSYPVSGGDFDTAMSSAVAWFNFDEWDNETNYSYVSANTATLDFQDCAIVYTIDFVNGVTRAPLRC